MTRFSDPVLLVLESRVFTSNSSAILGPSRKSLVLRQSTGPKVAAETKHIISSHKAEERSRLKVPSGMIPLP